MSRRPAIDMWDDNDEQVWEMKGSGLGESAAENLIHQLYVSLDSIRAGKTSSKLRDRVVSLLSVLSQHGVIKEYEMNKIFSDYIGK